MRVVTGTLAMEQQGLRTSRDAGRAGMLDKPELVSRLLHLHFKDDKTKVSGDALQLMVELLKVFVVEAAVRGVRQAQAEDALRVDVDQLEKVLPQLLLDF
ncbi:centromere protein X isoform X17 [Gorilla gorilla gorilla]|uniref:centromere protein X isoform X17 n=1 Tax=Gorilla gorilla gorilla TaxID=9595 RepID=UPI002445A3F5|nr:centromere protein X isoform X14 [Gorilla gorilla gorilla]